MTMFAPVALLPNAVPELFARVAETGQVTIADRYGLMAAVLDESISDEERFALDRVLRAVCRGRFQMVDELSSVL